MMYLFGGMIFFFLFHGFMWPFSSRPAPGWPMVWDAFLTVMVMYYVHLHLSRRKKYRDPRKKWGVIREDEFEKIDTHVQGFLEAEHRANCPECRGTGSSILGEICKACMGNGYRGGQVRRPFLIDYPGRNRVFVGWNALDKTPVFLTGEERFQTTNIYGIQGTGKTKRIGHLINRQLLFDKHASLVYFSLKTEDAESIERQALSHGWAVHHVQGISLSLAFDRWTMLEQAFRLGMAAAGYQSRESFWFDRAMQLLKEGWQKSVRTGGTARLGPVLADVIVKLREAAKNNNVRAEEIAVSDISGYLIEMNDPTSPVRWLFDLGPKDLALDSEKGLKYGGPPDWSLLAKPGNLMIIPPIPNSKAGIVAANALKYSAYLWIEHHKQAWSDPNPETRHLIGFIADEGDNFALVSSYRALDDVYATKTWREAGYSGWVYTQSKDFMRLALKDKARAYLSVVGNTITFAIPDDEITQWIKEMPEYEYEQRSLNMNRRGDYNDYQNRLGGNLQVTRGESLQITRGPWITGAILQKLPKGCAVLQRTGKRPVVLWIPYFDHVAWSKHGINHQQSLPGKAKKAIGR